MHVVDTNSYHRQLQIIAKNLDRGRPGCKDYLTSSKMATDGFRKNILCFQHTMEIQIAVSCVSWGSFEQSACSKPFKLHRPSKTLNKKGKNKLGGVKWLVQAVCYIWDTNSFHAIQNVHEKSTSGKGSCVTFLKGHSIPLSSDSASLLNYKLDLWSAHLR